jgi:hypothetical protein
MLDEPIHRELVDDSQQLTQFVTDYAQGFYEVEDICERYGFVNRAVLFHFVRSNAALSRLINQHKTAYESDDNVERRIRLKAGLAVERAISTIAHLVVQTETPIGQKIECFHKLLRAAGTDGPPPAPLRGVEGGGPSFTLNFIWSDGTKENVLTARPSAPVIEHDQN